MALPAKHFLSQTRNIILKLSTTNLNYSVLNNLRLLSSTAPRLRSAAAATPDEPSQTSQSQKLSVSVPTGEEKKYDPKLVKIVNEIASLTLIEVAELNECLKKTLNIPDAPMMMPMAGGFVGGGQAGGGAQQEEEEIVPQKVQTSFTLKLLKFDDTKKVALIKEIKSLLEGMNLVQAKKFVESAPAVVKGDISKEEAEKLSAALTAVGATCEIS